MRLAFGSSEPLRGVPAIGNKRSARYGQLLARAS